jgi:aminoglycoside phosphotransferase (APT) family kinase protein
VRGVDDVRRVIAAHRPGRRVDSIVPLGRGLDHAAYEVDGDLVVRFGHEPGSAVREARLLAAVAEVSPLPVPRPAFADDDCLAYPKLPGVPLLDRPAPERARHAPAVAARLGDLLAALRCVDADPDLAPVDDTPPARWLAEAAEAHAGIAAEVPPAHRPAVAAFLAARPPEPDPARVFSHNDLGIEHVLVDPATGRITGVIDWSDAAVVDPAYDFGLILRDLGPAALAAAVVAYGHEVSTGRAAFYARCALIEDLAYGLRTGRAAYAAKSYRGLVWLFPAAVSPADPSARRSAPPSGR